MELRAADGRRPAERLTTPAGRPDEIEIPLELIEQHPAGAAEKTRPPATRRGRAA